MRYKRHHFTAKGLASPKIAEEFMAHALEETAHGDSIAERIVQLGGETCFVQHEAFVLGDRQLGHAGRIFLGAHEGLLVAINRMYEFAASGPIGALRLVL